ncbi:hypothetical protein [Streptomyces sp. NPDC001816]|uniref:hypothetical protein n=1 Tax=Streptomyces sp. NPDC001816 TaxID=3364612 RepID=UPI0036B4D5C6
MTQEHSRRGWRRKIVAASAMGLAVAGTVGFVRLWNGEPYPVADPATTATRLDGYTQAVYDALDLPNAELDTDRPGRGMEADGYGCSYSGLSHLSEQLSDSPPIPPGVVNVSDEWALKGVSRAQAVSALQRARKQLTRRGWEVTGYENSRIRLWLALKPSDSDDGVWIEAYPANRLEVAARTADCARYPSGTPLNSLDEPAMPPQVAPVQLRR